MHPQVEGDGEEGSGDEQPLVVLSLDRKTFTRVMGPMEEILKRNMEQYNKIKSTSI